PRAFHPALPSPDLPAQASEAGLPLLEWDRHDIAAVQQGGVASAGSEDPDGGSMIQDFLRTMDRFLTVQTRVMQGCLGTGPTWSSDPGAMRGEEPELAPPVAPAITTVPITDSPGNLELAEPIPGVPRDHPFPLLGSIVAWTAGEKLVARRTFTPA